MYIIAVAAVALTIALRRLAHVPPCPPLERAWPDAPAKLAVAYRARAAAATATFSPTATVLAALLAPAGAVVNVVAVTTTTMLLATVMWGTAPTATHLHDRRSAWKVATQLLGEHDDSDGMVDHFASSTFGTTVARYTAARQQMPERSTDWATALL